MTDSLRYCISMVAAAKPWFDRHGHSTYLAGLQLLVSMEAGEVFADSEVSRMAAMVDDSSPDMDDADSALASVALSCCAGIASVLFARAKLRDKDSARELFIDSIDLAVSYHDKSFENATADELLAIPEVKESLNNIPCKVSLSNLPLVLAIRPAWAEWIDSENGS